MNNRSDKIILGIVAGISVLILSVAFYNNSSARLSHSANTTSDYSAPTSSEKPIPNTHQGYVIPPALGDCIYWTDANRYVGQTVAVAGPVLSSYQALESNGYPTFINIGADYPDESRFQIIIWGDDLNDHFKSADIKNEYVGRWVVVRGTVSIYNGVAQIEVKYPSSIRPSYWTIEQLQAQLDS